MFNQYKDDIIMSKYSNRIKRYAINNFDFHLDQSLHMSNFNRGKTRKSSIHEDQDMKLREAPAKLAYTTSAHKFNKWQCSSQTENINQNNNSVNDDEGEQSLHLQQTDNNQPQKSYKNLQTPHAKSQHYPVIIRSTKKLKSRYANFIELSSMKKTESDDKNIGLQHKIDRMRDYKMKSSQKQNQRSLYLSANKKQRSQTRDNMHNSLYRKTDNNFRRDRQNGGGGGYVPIGYNGQRLEKKVSKVSDLAKYNTHFIDMEITINPNAMCVGSDGKQNIVKKQNVNYNVFEQNRQKKSNQILNSKNVYYAVFRAPTKKITEQQKKLQYQRKLQNFINKTEDSNVQITLRELMQFKQIVYRRREQEYFLAQQQMESEIKQDKEESLKGSQKNIGSSRDNVIRKDEVNIGNLRNYQQLINTADTEQFKGNHRKKDKSRTIEVSLIAGGKSKKPKQESERKDNPSQKSIHFRNKTARKLTIKQNKQRFESKQQ